MTHIGHLNGHIFESTSSWLGHRLRLFAPAAQLASPGEQPELQQGGQEAQDAKAQRHVGGEAELLGAQRLLLALLPAPHHAAMRRKASELRKPGKRMKSGWRMSSRPCGKPFSAFGCTSLGPKEACQLSIEAK